MTSMPQVPDYADKSFTNVIYTMLISFLSREISGLWVGICSWCGYFWGASQAISMANSSWEVSHKPLTSAKKRSIVILTDYYPMPLLPSKNLACSKSRGFSIWFWCGYFYSEQHNAFSLAIKGNTTVYSTVLILGLSLNFGQFDKLIASKLLISFPVSRRSQSLIHSRIRANPCQSVSQESVSVRI